MADVRPVEAKVRVRQVNQDRWQVSLVRELGHSSVVEGDRRRVLQLAIRAASLLPRWERAESEPPRARRSRSRAPRYLVVDPTSKGTVRLPDGRRGKLLAAYHTPELAEAFALDQQDYSDSVVIMDSRVQRLVYSSSWPREWLDGGRETTERRSGG